LIDLAGAQVAHTAMQFDLLFASHAGEVFSRGALLAAHGEGADPRGAKRILGHRAAASARARNSRSTRSGEGSGGYGPDRPINGEPDRQRIGRALAAAG